MNFKEIIKAYAYSGLAAVSTVSIFSIAVSLLPVAEWARIQNDCVQRTIAFEGLPDRVWSCNGGGR